jgi:hypothetical protein
MTNKVEISNNAALAACEQVLAIYREADSAVACVGTKTARAIVAWCETTPPDVIQAATDREKVGVAQGSTEASRLSNIRAFARVVADAPEALDEILSADRGFNAIISDVRAVVKTLKAEAAVAREVKAHAKHAAIIYKDNPEAVKAEVENFAERFREFKAGEAVEREAQRKADAENPVKVAERIARRLIKSHGPVFTRDVADSMLDAISKVLNETAEEAAAAEA